MTLITSTRLSPNHYNGRQGKTPFVIGIHTMEAPEAGNTAENVAAYFGNSVIQASAHWCVDNDSRVRVVNDDDAAWTMPPLNDQSLNIEMAGYAAQTTKQWADAYSLETLDNAALCAAEWCHKYGIPIRHLTDAQIAAGNKGFVGHIDVNRVFHASDHTDPGTHFPWTSFLTKVTAHYDNMPTPVSGNCKPLQQAVGATADGVWGQDTDKRGMTVKWASFHQFPNGIAYARQMAQVASSGIWDGVAEAGLTRTIKRMQIALKAMGYDPKDANGDWSLQTEASFQAARRHFHG